MNMKTKPDDFAYPKITPDGDKLQRGLTIRQYYAGLAMQGLLAEGNAITNENWTSRWAVKQADALIAELNKEQ